MPWKSRYLHPRSPNAWAGDWSYPVPHSLVDSGGHTPGEQARFDNKVDTKLVTIGYEHLCFCKLHSKGVVGWPRRGVMFWGTTA